MPSKRTPDQELELETALAADAAAELAADADDSAEASAAALPDEAWDVFELDEETVEPEPEYGDFWGELDDDELT